MEQGHWVKVEKTQIVQGRIFVKSETPDLAGDHIEACIADGTLSPDYVGIVWEDSVVVPNTFVVKE